MENEFITKLGLFYLALLVLAIFLYIIIKKWFRQKRGKEKIIEWFWSGLDSGILVVIFGIYVTLWGFGIFGGNESRYEYRGENETHYFYKDKGFEPTKLRFVHFITGGACIIFGIYRIVKRYSKNKKNRDSTKREKI